jgi:hypothetical protein
LPFLELSSIQISEIKHQVNRGKPHLQLLKHPR